MIDFDLESREFNGRWYTDVKPWKIEATNATASQDTPPQYNGFVAPAPPFEAENPADDLPF